MASAAPLEEPMMRATGLAPLEEGRGTDRGKRGERMRPERMGLKIPVLGSKIQGPNAVDTALECKGGMPVSSSGAHGNGTYIPGRLVYVVLPNSAIERTPTC